MHTSAADEYLLQFRRDWYLDALRDELIPALKAGELGGARALKMVYRRFVRNKGDNHKGVLSEGELEQFFSLVKEIACQLDDRVLWERGGGVPFHFKRYMDRLRGGRPADDGGEAGDGCLTGDGESGERERLRHKVKEKCAILSESDRRRAYPQPLIRLRSLMFHEGFLLLEGYYDPVDPASADFAGGDLIPPLPEPDAGRDADRGGADRRLMYSLNGEGHRVPTSGLTETVRYFGRTLAVFPLFRLVLTEAAVSDGTLWFFMDGEDGPLELIFTGSCACLCPRLGCFWGRVGPLSVVYLPKERRLCFRQPGVLHRWKLGGRALAGLFMQRFGLRKKFLETGLLLLYHLTRPYYRKKEIWLYFDKLYMGGDNGQYLFAFASAHLPEVLHYYIIRKDAKAYGELKAAGLRPLAFGSLKNRLVALHATAILATHSNVRGFVGLNGFEQRFYAGRMRAKVVCIQHGLTIQDIPQYQGRTVDNTCLYFCAASREIENLSKPSYGYQPSMLRLTGLPRYDGLISVPEPLILLAPTWRRSVVREGNRMGTAKERNPLFRETDWYQIYAAILTDPRLLAVLKACGGKLRFLLHPTLSAQREDFDALIGADQAPWITVSPATTEGYEDVLRRASLLVTDFSGIQFDFAWMRKPILYFHPDRLPPTYGTEGFDYEREGFGPVIGSEEDLIDAVVEMADNGFRLPETYETRAETFFAWHDHRNCERILHELRNTLLES